MALNLINYLGRLIYAKNIYEVYVNNSNQSDYVSEMKEYITHKQSVGSNGLNNRFDLIEGITFVDGHINIDKLIFLRKWYIDKSDKNLKIQVCKL